MTLVDIKIWIKHVIYITNIKSQRNTQNMHSLCALYAYFFVTFSYYFFSKIFSILSLDFLFIIFKFCTLYHPTQICTVTIITSLVTEYIRKILSISFIIKKQITFSILLLCGIRKRYVENRTKKISLTSSTCSLRYLDICVIWETVLGI